MTLRLGVLTFQPEPYADLRERWRRVEAMGFDSVWVADGLTLLDGYLAYEAWTVLGALCRETSRVRIGTLVSTVHQRHPALVAKAALTIDHISGGRLELGLGAGDPVDRGPLGRPVWSAEERAGRLEEYVRIVDSLTRGDEVAFAGTYYRTKLVLPPPVQRPRPPILIAANAPAATAVAARYADAWNTLGGQPEGDAELLPLGEAVDRTRQQLEVLDEACASAGREPRSIRRTMLVFRARPPIFASVDRFEELVGRYSELGIEEFYVGWPGVTRRAPEQEAVMERVAAEVIPRLRLAAARRPLS